MYVHAGGASVIEFGNNYAKIPETRARRHIGVITFARARAPEGYPAAAAQSEIESSAAARRVVIIL